MISGHHKDVWDSLDYRLEDYRSQESTPKDYRSQESTPKDYRSQELTDLQVLAREEEASEYQLILMHPAVLFLYQ